jgi:uncharacterized membrane protein
MGFWIFMLIMDMLIPLTMIVLGRLFMNRVPKKINYIYGYRTAMSMKNKDTWDFAHRHCGKTWLRVGWVMLPLSVVVMLVVTNGDIDTVGTVGGVLCGLQSLVLVLSIIPTEKALKKTFDKDGNRKAE